MRFVTCDNDNYVLATEKKKSSSYLHATCAMTLRSQSFVEVILSSWARRGESGVSPPHYFSSSGSLKEELIAWDKIPFAPAEPLGQ